MKKFLWIALLLIYSSAVFAVDDVVLSEQNTIQSRINNVGTKILNSNKLEKRVLFVYDECGKIVYENTLKECLWNL